MASPAGPRQGGRETRAARPPETAAARPGAATAGMVAGRPAPLQTKAAAMVPLQSKAAGAPGVGLRANGGMGRAFGGRPSGAMASVPAVARDDSAAAATGTVRGYAALFHQVDLAGDRILPGAFAASLARRGAAGIRMLWQHEPGRPIGVWTRVAEDARGLFVEGRLAMETRGGREAFQLIAAGAVDGLSIGFRTTRAARETAPGGARRRLVEIDLWEISVVTFPMQQGARVRAVGNEAAPLALRLRDGAQRLRAGAQEIAVGP